jgi:Family of unknown function (DUF6390)
LTKEGLLFHAKHAYMPNKLGYCGPDDRGRILEALERSSGGEKLVSTLTEFEAAYPFLKLIARSTGRSTFDYAVPEAYWIGNGLLDRVPVPEFYRFSANELRGKDPREVMRVFRTLRDAPRPHHSFYVMSTYASSSVADGPSLSNENASKIAGLVDSCRVSWGTVKTIGDDSLVVEYRPMEMRRGKFVLGGPKKKTVKYNPQVGSFSSLRAGAVVSLHWDYACEVLTPRQVRNISRYTQWDMDSVNGLVRHRDR